MSLLIQHVSKTYENGVKALDGINLDIPKGMFGLLGPNGAGKSSLMRTIATLQEADEGAVRFNQIDVLREKEVIRSKLGYLPQEFGVYPKISARELLDYLASLKGMRGAAHRKSEVQNLLHLTNLIEHQDRSVATFSGGMKQRFGIAQALLGEPELIIVDEPTAGLDPEERLRFYNILSEVGHHVTIILSTHIVSDVSDLCQNFAIINKGRLLTQTTPALATKAIEGMVWSKIVSKPEAEDLALTYRVIASKFIGGNRQVKIFSPERPREDFAPAEPQLEDFYFAHVKGYVR